jgi:thiamine pyrophosphokinase
LEDRVLTVRIRGQNAVISGIDCGRHSSLCLNREQYPDEPKVNSDAVTLPAVSAETGVTLVAGGPVARRELRAALRRAPYLIAADGGADRAMDLGEVPRAVIGDMDSLSAAGRARLAAVLHEVSEQETTDFEKVLSRVAAPFLLALGVLGGQTDHGLAALSALLAARFPVLALSDRDVVFAAPPRLALHLAPGDRLSLYPLLPVRGESRGLVWPIGDLAFSPSGRIGTSNRVSDGQVDLAFDGPGMIVILPRQRLDAALAALVRPADGRGRSAARGG